MTNIFNIKYVYIILYDICIYQVSKIHADTTVSEKIVYLWAKSLGLEGAVKLCIKMKMIEAVVNQAIENQDFEFAFNLASRQNGGLTVENVYFKRAVQFEILGRYDEAVTDFLQAKRPLEALQLRIRQLQWEEALRIAEIHDPALISTVLVEQAKYEFANDEVSKAKALLLRAQQPEVMVQLYKTANRWWEAIQFVYEFIPAIGNEILRDFELRIQKDDKELTNQFFEVAKFLESNQQYSRALDFYMKINPSNAPKDMKLQEILDHAVTICERYQPNRLSEIIPVIGNLLKSIQDYKRAGELYLQHKYFKDAIDCFISANLWERAKSVLAYAPDLTQFVEAGFVKYLQSAGNADALINVDVNAALNIFAERGEWAKCLDIAAANVSFTYSLFFSSHLFSGFFFFNS